MMKRALISALRAALEALEPEAARTVRIQLEVKVSPEKTPGQIAGEVSQNLLRMRQWARRAAN